MMHGWISDAPKIGRCALIAHKTVSGISSRTPEMRLRPTAPALAGFVTEVARSANGRVCGGPNLEITDAGAPLRGSRSKPL